MKKFSVGVVAGVLCSWALAMASSGIEHNGLFWKRLDSSAKAGYVSGYADAMQVSVGKLDNLTVAADLFHWKGANKIIRQLSRELSVADLTSGDVVKRLDDLYSNGEYGELDLSSAVQLLTMSNGDVSEPRSHAPAK
jgi:hypothetical protein